MEAKELQKQVIEIRSEIVKKNYLNTISSINNLAFILYKQKQKEEAKKLNIKIIKTKINIQGLMHPDTLISIARLLATNY